MALSPLMISTGGTSLLTLHKKITPGCLITKGRPEGFTDRFLIPTDGSQFYIGTEESSSMPVQNPFISRRHLSLGTENGSCYVEDRKSTNKTRLRAQVIEPEQRYTLEDGDEITLAEGEIILLFKTHVEMGEGESGDGRAVSPVGSDTKNDVSGDALGIYVDLGKHEVYIDGRKVVPDIQSKAFDLLSLLFEYDGDLLCWKDIKERIWGEERGAYIEATHDSYGNVIREREYIEHEPDANGEIHQLVRRIRARFKEYSDFEYIQSVRNEGYKLTGLSR